MRVLKRESVKIFSLFYGLLRRYAPRNDKKRVPRNDEGEGGYGKKSLTMTIGNSEG